MRSQGAGRLTGFDTATGIVQVEGDSVCFGDSGGPVLSADGSTVLGVIGQVSEAAGACGDGLSFGYTAANANVRWFLAQQCASVGRCGPLAAGGGQGAADGSTADDGGVWEAGAPADADAAATSDGGALDAQASSSDVGPASRGGGDGCSVGERQSGARRDGTWACAWLLTVGVLVMQRRAGARRRAGRSGLA